MRFSLSLRTRSRIAASIVAIASGVSGAGWQNCYSVSIKMKLSDPRLMLQDTSVISRSPDIMSGTPVFAGTRVPIQTLLDYLKAGESIDDFLEGFPTVTRDQVIAILGEIEQLVITAK